VTPVGPGIEAVLDSLDQMASQRTPCASVSWRFPADVRELRSALGL
jgi:hypothetical protein